jgi:hypothetical protein
MPACGSDLIIDENEPPINFINGNNGFQGEGRRDDPSLELNPRPALPKPNPGPFLWMAMARLTMRRL